jgi:hypothetical protein
MIELRRHAPLAELAAMMASLTPASMQAKLGPYTLAARHAALTRSWGAYEGETCVACGGLYAREGGVLEAWFACRPDAGQRILAISRKARLTLSIIAETESVEIRAHVAPGWLPGQRLARALGFALAESGVVEVWIRRRP